MAKQLHWAPQAHTRLCAQRINQFWLERGREANARAEPESGIQNPLVRHIIVSDLRNGLPP